MIVHFQYDRKLVNQWILSYKSISSAYVSIIFQIPFKKQILHSNLKVFFVVDIYKLCCFIAHKKTYCGMFTYKSGESGI